MLHFPSLRNSLIAFAAGAVSLSLVALPTVDAGASAGAGLTIAANPGSLATGALVNLTTTQPVTAAGTTTNTIVDHIDPAKIRITNVSQIVAPTGWTLSYSSDGSNYSTTTPTNWTTISWIKATGPVVATGVSNGKVIAQSTDSQTASSLGSISAGGAGGDGWDVAIAANGDIFNMYHHDGAWQTGFKSGALDCHSRATGQECAGNWPFEVTDLSNPNALHTNTRAYEWIDNTHHHLWFPTSNDSGTGFGCIDISNEAAPEWCGGSLATGFVQAQSGDGGSRDSTNGFAAVGTRLFTFSVATGSIDCVDTAANDGAGAACPNQPFATGITGQPSDTVASMMALNGLVMGVDNGSAFCIDPSTLADCTGWAGPITTAFNSLNGGVNTSTVYPQPASDGTTAGMCIFSVGYWNNVVNPIECYTTGGAALTPDSGLSAAILSEVGAGNATSYVKPWQQQGSKLFFNNAYPAGNVWCYDVSTQDWCSGWSSSGASPDWSDYTVTLDPTNPNCLWTNGDQQGISVINTANGAAGCPSLAPTTVTFDDSLLLQRLSCAGSSIHSWQTFDLTSPVIGDPNGTASATLTISDSSGNPISGWTNVTIPPSGIVDLSALSVVDTGANPTITVNFTGRSITSLTTTALLSAVSDQPQLCLHAIASSCPLNVSGMVPAQPASSTQPSSTGSVQVGSDPEVTSGPVTTHIAIGPASASQCGGTIRGTASKEGGGKVGGAQVTLIDNQTGQPVLVNGQPVTTTTASDGSYSFEGMNNGCYSVEFSNLNDSTTIKSYTSATLETSGVATGPTLTSACATFSDTGDPNGPSVQVDATFAKGPGRPTGVDVETGTSSVVVSWTPPTDDGGSPVTSYTVFAGPNGGSCTYVVGDLPANQCTISDLSTFQRMHIEVMATNANANSNVTAPIAAEVGSFGLSQDFLQLEILQNELFSSTDLATWTDLGSVGADKANALAFNPKDDFAYAVANASSGAEHLLRLAANGQVEVAGTITNQVGRLTSGAIDPTTGVYYVTSSGNRLYKLVKTGTSTYRVAPVRTAPGLWIGADFTIANGVLVTVYDGKVFQWTIGKTSRPVVGKSLGLGEQVVIGAMWTDPSQGFDFRDNVSQTIYHLTNLSSQTPTVTVVATGNGLVMHPVDGTTVLPDDTTPDEQ